MKKKNMRTLALGAAMLGLVAVPMVAMPVGAMAGFDLTVNIGADDQSHFDFNAGPGHHTPEIWKAAKQLQNAKHTLWKARDDFHGHKADAIQAINAALDQLKTCEGM
jgi:hypothetical protein